MQHQQTLLDPTIFTCIRASLQRREKGIKLQKSQFHSQMNNLGIYLIYNVFHVNLLFSLVIYVGMYIVWLPRQHGILRKHFVV